MLICQICCQIPLFDVQKKICKAKKTKQNIVIEISQYKLGFFIKYVF